MGDFLELWCRGRGKGLGRGLEGVVFQRLAREEGRCTVWAGLIRHAARGDGGMG